jgi:glycosyltransferase involved in cell wall biosynthesis
MKILLVGPYPPPHGGISVHVYELRKRLHMAGIDCRVVNVDPHALESAEYLRIRGGLNLVRILVRYARRGWALHVHINGHNTKSWLIALAAGAAGRFGPGNVLTLHSGLAPQYLAPHRRASRFLAGVTCGLYKRLIAVSPEVLDAVLSLGVGADRVQVVPAFMATRPVEREIPQLSHLKNRRPLLATTLFFRPEYGFELLVDAMDQLRPKYPDIAWLVIGSGEEHDRAEKLVAQRGLQESMLLLGNVPHEMCLQLISRADIFVRPTLVDGDATSVREALAMGKRVVASDVGHRPAGVVLFRKGDAADLAEKLEAAWLRPAPAPALGDDNADTLIGLYESLVHTRREGDYGKTQPLARHAHR